VSRIYHIATRSDWARAQRDGEYATSTIGRSTQVADVANRFYRGVPDELVLLVIDPDRVRAPIRYEQVPGAEDPFPHIYGPLNPDAVLAARPFSPAQDGSFTFPDP
jgi:uncharacterized protein (DUF952 family)